MKKNVIDYFFDTAFQHGSKTAIIDGSLSISFDDLKMRIVNLAHHILSHGNFFNQPIAVYIPKSINCVVADLAATLSGNPYMNLDVKSPVERTQSILRNVQPAVIICNDNSFEAISTISGGAVIINIDHLPVLSDASETPFLHRLLQQIDTDPLCIINTSGSTGTPKAVVLNHRSYINYTHWAINQFKFDGEIRMGMLSPTIFDHYNYELCLMMITGASIVMLDNNMAMFPVKLLEEVKRLKVNYIFWVPTIMVNIANMDLLAKVPLPDIRMVWFAGEVFPTKQFNYWKQQLPQATFVNLYGPTETTVDCTFYVVERELSNNEPIPIGHPCFNTDILILTEDNNRVVGNEEGELCVRGTSLAMGYYNNPDKTAEAFVQNPMNKAYPEWIYRTGDIVSYNEYGELVFRGRKDSLIKHLGYRIELTEIEHVIVNQLKLVDNACALYDFNKKEIVLVYERAEQIEIAGFRKATGEVLPKYMVPTRLHYMQSLPKNTSGKIDRATLKAKFLT